MTSFASLADERGQLVAQRPRDRAREEPREPLGLGLVERDRGGRHAALVPHAEADVRVVRQVARDPQRLVGIARMRPEELDELAPLRRGTPRTEAKRVRDRAAAL